MKRVAFPSSTIRVAEDVRGMESAKRYFEPHEQILTHLPYREIELVADQIMRVYQERRTLFLFGNGGSAALASHFACDLGKGTLSAELSNKRLRAISLTDNIPLMTAWANDNSYQCIFSEQLDNLLAPEDAVLAISGSGNSENVLHALKLAKDRNAFTIGLTGYDGGKMRSLCDLCIIIPADDMQVIEDFQLSIAHALFRIVKQRIEENFRPVGNH